MGKSKTGVLSRPVAGSARWLGHEHAKRPVSIPSTLDSSYNFDVSYTGATQNGPRVSATRLVVADHTLGSVVPPSGRFGWRPFATKPYSDLSTRATLVRAAE